MKIYKPLFLVFIFSAFFLIEGHAQKRNFTQEADEAFEDQMFYTAIDKYKKILVDEGASVLKVDNWGTRTLAYTVKKQTQGCYVLVIFDAPAEAIAEFERVAELAPDHGPTYNYLGGLYYRTERWDEAIAGFEKVIPAPEFGGSFVHVGTKDRWGLEVSYRF